VKKKLMMTKTFKFLVAFTLIAVLLAGCKSSGKSPDEVYWQYWEACSEGKFSKAESYLSEDAKTRTKPFGICGFTHDAVNNIEISSGRPAWTFSQPPEIVMEGDFALLTWITEEGSLSHVTLIRVEGEWKIDETSWLM
jgi:hypothetical protein